MATENVGWWNCWPDTEAKHFACFVVVDGLPLWKSGTGEVEKGEVEKGEVERGGRPGEGGRGLWARNLMHSVKEVLKYTSIFDGCFDIQLKNPWRRFYSIDQFNRSINRLVMKGVTPYLAFGSPKLYDELMDLVHKSSRGDNSIWHPIDNHLLSPHHFSSPLFQLTSFSSAWRPLTRPTTKNAPNKKKFNSLLK